MYIEFILIEVKLRKKIKKFKFLSDFGEIDSAYLLGGRWKFDWVSPKFS